MNARLFRGDVAAQPYGRAALKASGIRALACGAGAVCRPGAIWGARPGGAVLVGPGAHLEGAVDLDVVAGAEEGDVAADVFGLDVEELGGLPVCAADRKVRKGRR